MLMTLDTESWDDFTTRLLNAMADADTHIYVDTSFLMWLTKLSTQPRTQFFQWIDASCSGRLHVPVWAAHEYANHHVENTIVAELDLFVRELKKVASGAYSRLRPFLDAKLEQVSTPEHVRAKAVQTLTAVGTLAASVSNWKSFYPQHAREVMKFISDHEMVGVAPFDLMKQFPALGDARFDGRLPPGFHDRGKREKGTSGAYPAVTGSNKYGDLIFWQEILDDARNRAAKRIVILSKDNKNDWHFGGRTPPQEQALFGLRRSWKPLPRPHPTLVAEARAKGGIEDVMLIDSVYLGAVLSTKAVQGVESFVDVAIAAEPESARDERQQLAERERSARELRNRDSARAANLRFIEPPRLTSTSPALRLALLKCQSGGEPSPALSAAMSIIDAAASDRLLVLDLLKAELFSEMDNTDVALLGKSLHHRVLQDSPGYLEVAAEILADLTHFPPKFAGLLLLGFWVPMYVPKRDECRIPATSPLLDQLASLSHESFAKVACDVIDHEIDRAELRPIYRPTSDEDFISCDIGIEQEASDTDVLLSLEIGGESLLVDLQYVAKLNIRELIGKREVITGVDLIQLTSRLFGIPVSAIRPSPALERTYSVPEALGFREPSTVYLEPHPA